MKETAITIVLAALAGLIVMGYVLVQSAAVWGE